MIDILINPYLFFSDEVIILSAMGTAAKINLNVDPVRASAATLPQALPLAPDKPPSGERDSKERDKSLFVDITLANQPPHKNLTSIDG